MFFSHSGNKFHPCNFQDIFRSRDIGGKVKKTRDGGKLDLSVGKFALELVTSMIHMIPKLSQREIYDK